MYLNIITPCCRPANLQAISKSINIPLTHYRWIVIFDSENIPDLQLPATCEPYTFRDKKSVAGHSQRNFAKKLVHKGHIYFNDDDTVIHPDLWNNIKDLDNDFISFSQNTASGDLRLYGDVIEVKSVDTHNFITSCELLRNNTFVSTRYDADGIYAKACYAQAKSPIFIPKVLSVYNALRPEASIKH